MNRKKRVLPSLLRFLSDDRRMAAAVPVLAVLLSLGAASIVVLFVGKSPLHVFRSLLQGAGLWVKPSYAAKKSVLTDFMSFLNALTPMLFAALAVAAAFKAGLFNIGVSGQMLFAGFLATVCVGYSGLPALAAKPLVLLIGMAAGAAAGGAIGWLKHRFNINEVVSSIMLNYIFQYVVSFFIHTRFIDPVSRQSRYIGGNARLTLTDVEAMGVKMDIPLGILLAVAAAFALRFLLDKTRAGFEIKMVGASRKAARYAGVRVGRSIVSAMILSGALAGLAGVTYYLGYFSSIRPRALTTVGFDAIAVSLLGNSNPAGILFSSFLISVVDKGSTYMSSSVGVEREIASVVTGLILLFSACGTYLRFLLRKAAADVRAEDGGRGPDGPEGAKRPSKKGGDT